ncbi:MAG: ornithine cyclodeaminase family protein [Gemmataceae bacterium]|nr:ornithine cyclodeaminase family protein [Gemmataceae bacterium]
MPFLLLNEAEVRSLLTMEMALEAVEEGLRKLALDEAMNIPRARTQTDHAMLHVMSASAKTLGAMGYKAYTTSRKGADFHVGLFDSKTGELTALVQADYLGQVRTGAASGIATKYLARPEASTVGIYGAGKQARTQLLAICKTRAIKHILVFSRNEETRGDFCAEMAPLCECSVEPASRPEDAARDRDIVITATSSRDPVLAGDWLAAGTHLNVIGSNFLAKAEVDIATIQRAQLIVVDSKDQALVEAGDFRHAIDSGVLHWKDVRELGAVIAGREPRRSDASQITLFKSLGLAIEDIATAAKLVAKAKELNVGRWIDW